MNYLGHLFLSNNDTELMLTNLFGDFVKGKDLSDYRIKTQEGITLHRSIDHYIDTHPIVLDLLHILYPELPKVAGIAVDLFFDHLLAKHWSSFHEKELQTYLNDFYNSIDLNHPEFSEKFKYMISKLVEVNWISYYPTTDGLQKACNGVSKRISFPNELGKGLTVFLKHEQAIEFAFKAYMNEAMYYFNISPI